MRRDYPENTIPAFEAALRAGCDGVELDVRRLGDGTLVAHHDRTLRFRGRRRALSDVRERELRTWGTAGRRVAPLERILRWAKARPQAWVDLELKESGYEHEVWRVVRRSGRADRFVFTSFHLETCERLRALAPASTVGLISLEKEPSLVNTARELGLRALVLHETNAVPRLMIPARQAGLEVWAWGVRTASAARRLHAAGVKGFITDHPQRLLSLRSDASEKRARRRRLPWRA